LGEPGLEAQRQRVPEETETEVGVHGCRVGPRRQRELREELVERRAPVVGVRIGGILGAQIAGQTREPRGVGRELDETDAPRARSIRLVELATHTSGLPRLPGNLRPKDAANPYADYGSAALYEFLAEFALPARADPTPVYSNLGFGLLGHALALRLETGFAE